LEKLGFSELFVEKAPNSSNENPDTYKLFTARYGNIYTVNQALQLFNRAFELEESSSEIWSKDGFYHDPYRPNAAKFKSTEEALLDRKEHLTYVREAFTQSKVVIFTLGLTEGWQNIDNGTYYPIAPGVVAGNYDAARHKFYNSSQDEVKNGLELFVNKVKDINSDVRFILTVSPVPLAATYEKKHILVSTNYSKSVLLSAAHETSKKFNYVEYFPSYDLITSQVAQGRFFEADFRHVHRVGVSKAMDMFSKTYLSNDFETLRVMDFDPTFSQTFSAVNAVVCDEDLINPTSKTNRVKATAKKVLQLLKRDAS
jgi:hypothetical protein